MSADDPDKVLSMKMSQVLRHTGKDEGLFFRKDGFVLIDDLLDIRDGSFFDGFDEDDVQRVICQDAKNRFTLKENERGFWVRANQGHTGSTGGTIDDQALLNEILDASELDVRGDVCVHGTYLSCWDSIHKEGLKTMGRNHVHFATCTPESGQVISGMRSDSEILIYLDVPLLLKRGVKIYRSSNDVLLSRGEGGVIAPEFFHRVIQRRPYKELFVGAAERCEKTNVKPSLLSDAVSLRPSGYLGGKQAERVEK